MGAGARAYPRTAGSVSGWRKTMTFLGLAPSPGNLSPPKKVLSAAERQAAEEEKASDETLLKMKGSVERTIEIDATPEEVFMVASDFPDYPVNIPTRPRISRTCSDALANIFRRTRAIDSAWLAVSRSGPACKKSRWMRRTATAWERWCRWMWGCLGAISSTR